jgi:tryptophan synthase beta subunit
MISKTKFGMCGGQFVLETLIPAIEEFATGDLGAGKGNPVVMRFGA